jgi:hypothetical protein
MIEDTYRIFISAVSGEFENKPDDPVADPVAAKYAGTRSLLADDFQRRGLEVRVQQFFTQGGADTLLRQLHEYIKRCNAVVCIIGARSGSFPPAEAAKEFSSRLPAGFSELSYTQWELVFGYLYKKRMSIHLSDEVAGDNFNLIKDARQKHFISDVIRLAGKNRNYFKSTHELRLTVSNERGWPVRGVVGDFRPILPLDPVETKGIRRDNCPYLGPQQFSDSPEHLQLFFGRDKEARDIVSQLKSPDNWRTQILPIYAPSGTGKSSLINTLVRFILEQEGYEVLRKVRVGFSETSEFPDSVGNVFSFSIARSRCGGQDALCADQAQATLKDIVTRWKSEVGKDRDVKGWVIFLDQFEEIFFTVTHATVDAGKQSDHRREFFKQLKTLCENVPDVRVVLLVRKEYMYDVKSALNRYFNPNAIETPEYLLQKFGAHSAEEAIVRPAEMREVTIRPEVTVSLINGLAQEHKLNPTGAVLEIADEVIDPVHLSVVCKQLWQAMIDNKREDGKEITKADLEEICGKGNDIGVFVSNALESWYRRIVSTAAAKDAAKKDRYTPLKIYREMLKFVAATGDTRTKVQQGALQSGPFPNWLINILVDQWLLRWSEGGWYELTHERLIAPVREAAQIDEEGRRQNIITEKISSMIRDDAMDGHFLRHHEVNELAWAEVDPHTNADTKKISDTGQPGSTPDVAATKAARAERLLFSRNELAFIYRSTLAEGIDKRIEIWTETISILLPGLVPEILADAFQTTEPIANAPSTAGSSSELADLQSRRGAHNLIVRTAAAKAVGYLPAAGAGTGPAPDSLYRRTAEVAFEDKAPAVRNAAAISVARVDRPELYRYWAEALQEKGWLAGVNAVRSMANAMNERSWQENLTNFSDNCAKKLSLIQRIRVYCWLFAIRLHEGKFKFLYVVPLCAFAAAMFTGLVRWIPALWYYTWTQSLPPSEWLADKGTSPDFNPMQAIEGTFQAVCGGVGYAAAMSLTTAIAWIVLIRGCPGKTTRRRFCTLLAGMIGGIGGGAVLNLLILPVFADKALLNTGWVSKEINRPPAVAAHLLGRLGQTLPTHCPLIYPIYGLFLGLGCAWTILSFRPGTKGTEWEEIVKGGNIEGLKLLIWRTIQRSWRIAICMAMGAIALCYVLHPNTDHGFTVRMKNFCDAGSIVVGGIGYCIALLFGFMLIRNGFEVPSQGD